MPEALPALDLAAWLIFAVVFVLAITAAKVLKPIFQVIHDALGWIPFVGGWVDSATHKVVEALNEVIVGSRAAMSTLWQAFLWAFRLTVTVTEEAFGYFGSGYEQLVNHAIPGALANLYADVSNNIGAVAGELHSLESAVAQDVHDLERYADHAAGAALSTAEGYTDTWIARTRTWVTGQIDNAVAGVETDIGTAKRTAIDAAEGYADKLRAAIEGELSAAIAGVENDLGAAVRNLTSSIATVKSTLEGELTTAEQTIGQTITADVAALDALVATAEQTLSQAIAAAEQSASAALNSAVAELEGSIAAVRSAVAGIAGEIAASGQGAIDELGAIYGLDAEAIRKLLDSLDLSKLVEFGAALVLLRSFVETFAAEAGLGDPACRSKVKGICGTDANGWSTLLELAGGFLVLTDVCVVLPILEAAVSAVATPLVEALTVAGAGLCSASASAPPRLAVPAVELPSSPALDYQLAA